MSKAATWQAVLVLVIAFGCTQDYDKFSSPEEAAGDGGNAGFGGALGNAGASGRSGAFGSGGAAGTDGNSGTSGSAGTSGCDVGEKLCAGVCVANNDPETGCAALSCNACSSRNAVPVCGRDGACAVGSCASGFGNCDNQAGDGCEQDLTDDEHCGGCRNDCTSQGASGGFACMSGVCGCTSDAECREDLGGTGTATCNTINRTCVCDNAECRPGESCERQGSAQVCQCNGGTACMAGQTCCESPAGCRRLDTDMMNCGACGKACPMGFACQQGLCVQR